MDPPQTVGLQASWMTMVAHGVPVVPPTPVTIPSNTNHESTESTATNLVDTVLKITKEASEVFKDVPYIKAFAGVLIQIASIREEIQTEKDRSQELIDKILRRSTVILDGLLRVGSSSNRDQLKDIEGKLRDYNDLLGKILAALKARASKNLFDRVVNRKSRLGNLEKYDRLINDFNTDFVTDLHIQSHLANVSQGTSLPSASSDMVYYKPVLPPPSELMIGRDQEKSEVLKTLLRTTRARIAILGAGGMGKTTLALSSLHDPAVVEHFPSRYFVSCEAVTSTSALVGEIANVLRIPPAKRNQNLIDVVLSFFHGNAVLCLDNFETIWDDEAARSDVEGFLSHLNHLPQLAIIVTMRGTQRPSRVSWSKPLLPPLEKLSDADSRLIFEAIGGRVDVFVENLLKAIDGIPLAVTLVGALLQEGNETSESLWARWEKTRTTVVENGGKDRLSNLDTSIHLSVYGHRMRADPNTISILAVLSVLPDGFPHTDDSGPTVDELQCHLPEDTHLREAILTMRRVSLLQIDEANRLRMLAPIRHFCERRLETPEVLRNALTAFYTDKINNFTDVTDSVGHAIIPAELGNMHAVFVEACKRRRGDHAFVRACIKYTFWSLYIGNPVEEVICLAMENLVGSPGLLADCHYALSLVYLRRSKLDEAQASFECAVQLHREVNDVLGEADDVHKLGDVHMRRDKLDEAQASFECAVQLHREAHSILGEACDVRKLGDVHMRRSNLDEAQASFEHAIQLHRQARDVLGEANDVQVLADIHLRRDKLDEAQASLEHAVQLHKQAHDVLGEANDLQKLGDVHVRREKLDEAQASFEHAVQLHRQVHSILGEADDMQNLGDVHMRRDKLDEAQESFERALQLHRQGHDVLGEGYDVQKLGDVHLRRSNLDEAQTSFEHAVQLHRQAHDVLGEANAVRKLGDVQLRRFNLDEAQASFERAVQLHRQARNILGEANDVYMLGDVHMRRNELDEAQASLELAVKLHRQAHSILGEAYDVHKLGDVHMQRDQVDEAQVSFEHAVQLHRQAHDIPGEAYDVQKLGVVHLRRDRLDEAQASFEHANQLHTQAHDVFGKANDIYMLGDVHMQRDQVDEAQESFEHAIQLHRQVHDVLGEANDLQKLGDLHLRRDKLDEAQESFEKALALYRKAHSTLDEGYSHLGLGRLYLQQDNLQEAELCLNRALLLFRQAQSSPSEAAALKLLQQISVRRHQVSLA